MKTLLCIFKHKWVYNIGVIKTHRLCSRCRRVERYILVDGGIRKAWVEDSRAFLILEGKP